MRPVRLVVLCLLALVAIPQLRAQSDYAFGADVSFLKQAEDSGLVFKDNGVAKPGLEILRNHGYNWIRLRVFVDPAKARTNLPNNLAYAIALTKQAKALGMKVEVGFHYSDTWSD